ncbi:MAG TPA: chemotaxis response regulator protein-glutamate methylesterase [Longimicrobiaceae bacterium]
MAESIRVLLVDDSTFVRQAVQRMLSPVPGVEVVATAANGAEGITLARTLRPDVVILDVNLPDQDGLEVLRTIMEVAPTGVLMLSTLTSDGADVTMRALELGAVDFVDKTSAGTAMDIHRLEPVIREKVLAVAGASVHKQGSAPETVTVAEPPPPVQLEPEPRGDYDLVVIGSSTGGPKALMEVIASLPADLTAAVVVAQHMPAGFTRTLAERIDRRSSVRVREAVDGATLEPGSVYLAPGGSQISIERDGSRLRARVTNGSDDYLHRPSVDLLFRSAAAVAGSRTIGVILTGMGDDGAEGLRELREAGGRTLAESEQTAVIYGMPRAAAPWAERVLRLDEIGQAIAALCSGRSGTWEEP